MMDSSLHNAASNEGSTSLTHDGTGGHEEVHVGAWQYVALGLAMDGLYAIWGAGLQVLLPEQVSFIVGSANKAAALGIVTGIAAIVAMVSQPIMGVLSDRTRSRLGRRNVWVLGGSLVAAVIMLVVGHISTIPLLIVVWCCMQAAGNAIQTALTATIPERFPVSKRGTVSSVSGVGTIFGMFLGVAIGGLSGSIGAGYVIVGALALIFGILYTFTAREPKGVTEALARQKAEAIAAAHGQKKLDLPRSADYWWAFAGRFAIFLGYSGVSGYTLYILTDYIHISQSNAGLNAATGVVILTGISTLAMILSMALSGWIADKSGRLKLFVFWSSMAFALPMALLLLFPSWPTILAAQAITGLAFGLYMAVDQALMTRVLPNIENAARDLGILNIANAGPQVLAPFMASMIIAALEAIVSSSWWRWCSWSLGPSVCAPFVLSNKCVCACKASLRLYLHSGRGDAWEKRNSMPIPIVSTEDGFAYRDLNKNGRLDPYEDPRLPMEERVEDLLSQMTLEEKAGMLFQTMIAMNPDGTLNEDGGMFPTESNTVMVSQKLMNHFNVLFVTRPHQIAEWYNRLQALAEEARLGIPVTISSDPRHAFSNNPGANFMAGAFSQWPEPLGLAAINDPTLTREFGEIARQEYTAVGIRVALHPQADLATEPRWARINGTFGEDAERAGQQTAAYIRGFQGERIGPESVSCMVKHFPGGGPQKDGDDPHFAWGREQVYPGKNFDYHLKPFEDAFAAGVSQVMPYYGMPVGLSIEEVGFGFNKAVITGLLRLQAPYQKPNDDSFLASFFHTGDLDFKEEELAHILSILKQVPTIVDIYLDRPAVIPEIAEQSTALLANFGASDAALLDIVFGHAHPEGTLPFELPSSMEAVREQKSDVPFDTRKPVYRYGYGLRY